MIQVKIPTNTTQSGLCNIAISAADITPSIVLPTHAKPPKRSFAEIDEDVVEEPNSDELYGWIEDDEVATEGLLIGETPIDNPVTPGSRLDAVADGRNKKMTRTTAA